MSVYCYILFSVETGTISTQNFLHKKLGTTTVL